MIFLVQLKFFFYFGIIITSIGLSTGEFSYGQDVEPANNFEEAKSSSDEAISLIDSLKGSSLLSSVVEGMQNFTFPMLNQSVSNLESNDLNATLPSSDDILNSFAPNGTAINITNIYQNDNNNTAFVNNTSGNYSSTSSSSYATDNKSIENMQSINMQSIMVMPHPMTISSNEYIPLYSSKPSKILEGNILAKLPCNSTTPLLQIVGSFDNNNIYPVNLNILDNFSKSLDMCMYESVFSSANITNLQNPLTNLYLYNPLDLPIEVPNTTSIFIGIHKIMR